MFVKVLSFFFFRVPLLQFNGWGIAADIPPCFTYIRLRYSHSHYFRELFWFNLVTIWWCFFELLIVLYFFNHRSNFEKRYHREQLRLHCLAGNPNHLEFVGFALHNRIRPQERREACHRRAVIMGRSLYSTGGFSCITGDCGTGNIECAGATGRPPVTLFEFSLDSNGNQDFYDVSVVNGYNLPLVVVPHSTGAVPCSSVGCVLNLNKTCPLELKFGREQTVACMSACQAFRRAEYCCVGEYATPEKCKPTSYSQIFKRECPLAYSYVYDDASTEFTFSSNSTNYVITFCPLITPNTTRSIPVIPFLSILFRQRR